jgi:hypothetical protein
MTRMTAIGILAFLTGCADSYQPVEPETLPPPGPAVTGAPQATGDSSTPSSGAGVELAAIRLKAPESWTRNQPRSQFVEAEFALPSAEGDTSDGRLTISVAGGSVDANLERWRGQFGDGLIRDSQEALEVAGTTITVVDFSGTFNDQAGPFAPGVKREGYRMIGAIIPGSGQQLHFVKATGPEQTLAKHAESIREFLMTLEVK